MKLGPAFVDVAGLELTPDDIERLQHPQVGGVVLFARNFAAPLQLIQLTSSIRELRTPALLIAVDHEGGRVQRFRHGFTPIPPMRELGKLWDRDPAQALAAARGCGFVIGSELQAHGVDITFAPVLDVDYGESSVIGDRALHRDANVIALLAEALQAGLNAAGMISVGKHFPGHGYAHGDSHHELPIDERPLEAILGDDARPYEWLGTALARVMPAHVIYPRVDARPAGFSARWLKEILRQRLGFNGAIFSDDLSMEGAKAAGGHLEAALAALAAGCDMVLLCNQSIDGGAAIDALLDGLERAANDGRWQPDPDAEGRRLALLPRSPPLAWDELMHHAPYQHALERLP